MIMAQEIQDDIYSKVNDMACLEYRLKVYI